MALLSTLAILAGALIMMFAAIRHCRIVGGIVHRHLHLPWMAHRMAHCMMTHGARASEHGHVREALNRDRETE